MKITVLIPAHQEEKFIGKALAALRDGTRQPDRVVVACDNCTDDTAGVVAQYGYESFNTVGNKDRRAGALNQAMARVLPDSTANEIIVAMDADVYADPDMLANAERHFQKDPKLTAVSVNFRILGKGFIGLMETIEYERSRRTTGRKQGRGACMSGGCSMFRAGALRRVAFEKGSVYDMRAWAAEDWMLTFDLISLGYDKQLKPQDCSASMAGVPTWRGLFQQRQRWSQGNMQVLTAHGLTKYSALPWLKLAYLFLTLPVYLLWMALFTLALVDGAGLHIQMWLIAATGLLLFSRAFTVRKLGPKAVLAAATMLPETLYGWWDISAILSGVWNHVTGKAGQWNAVR